MRNILLTASAIAALAGQAHAAPAPSPNATWAGAYVGVNAGYGWAGNTDQVRGADAFTMGDWEYPGEINSPRLNQQGFVGGVQIGYNYPLAPSVVAGVEADLAGASMDDRASIRGTDDTSRVITGDVKMDLFGTVRGRIGYAPTNRFLAYATGGVAYASDSLTTGLSRPSAGLTGCENHDNNCETGSTSKLSVGWTAGAGLEWRVNNAWSVKAEYLYYDLGDISHLMRDTAYPSVFRATLPLRGDIVRVGANYMFGRP